MLQLQVEGLTDTHAIAIFINGLLDRVRLEVMVKPPKTLQAVIERATQVERKHRDASVWA
ncbi:hypothetical protein Scep_004598 [Stephania cephalantha]|uniref:Uncharacterized protein n=1 Tax=Stephania cephalantha TaxID=152367 RepID=A0AAP0KVM3_9MAGN